MFLPNLRWRKRRQGESVNSVGAQFRSKCRIDTALALDARQSLKRVGDNSDVEMRLAPRSRA
jgi:hypothetical protein